ncbi:methionyl-tRNA formyltransferase [Stappia sp. WLB 29]|uniref:methionyl-tRNA formyltransferase n=1 Tax=Stappia sp. WLB 29 TaxID=2925220 RepID=UPI0020BF71E6|nr:methionyl-tRNA formyltransferase [Stappia sp. WLB 29]
MRIVFMGTPEFSVPTLMEIVGQGHDVVVCYTQPPRKAGRGMDERKSAVHQAAETLGIPVRCPQSLKSEEERAALTELAPDAAVVVAYGLLLPQAVLDIPVHGCLNLHASLLPRWRGAAPINRAIMAGDLETGVEVMRMEAGLDTGPVYMAEKLAIGQDMTAGELHDRLSVLGADLMVRALAALPRGGLVPTPQAEEGVTYARKIDKAETRIDWALPAREVHDHVRGLSPFPGAWCEMEIAGRSERVKVLRTALDEGASGEPGTLLSTGDELLVACGSGAVRLVQLQRAGKKPMPAAEFQRGAQLSPGTRLS